MNNSISALTARTQFGQIMKRATKNDERFVVDRRGEPAVIIMSIKDFIKTIAPAPKELQAMWAESKKRGLDKLTMKDINREIKAYRKEKSQKQLNNS